jgi:uncharacterized protein YjiS (DUF1127 family)
MRPIDATARRMPESRDTAPPRPGLLSRLADLLWQWRHRAESRGRIAEMSDYHLRDIGMTRLDAAAEARKPFWMP